jgi:hypothetical protein
MSGQDWINWEKYYPDDLNKNNKVKTGQDYFTIPASDLKVGQQYSFNFQWVYPDGKVSPWSDGLTLTAANLPDLIAPKFLNTDLSYFNGQLIITWNGQNASGQAYTKAFDRINVYIKDETLIGSPYRLVGFFKSAGTIRVAVPPRAHSVKLTVVSINGTESDFSTAQFETPKIIPNTLPTGLAPAWVGTNFKLPFVHNPSEEFFGYYKVTLTAGGVSKVYDVAAVPGTTDQSFTLSLSQNRASFGVPQTSFTGSIKVVNIYGNESSAVSFSATNYANTLPAATIVATAISNGYSVSYTTPADATFDKIEIEEVESSSSTAPTTGYNKVFSGSSNPAITITPNTNKRWVRARFVDNIGGYGSYGTPVSATPTSPVVADTEGPADVASVTTSGGLDTSGVIGFNGYADISWEAVTGGGIRGYRIRFRPVTDPVSSYSYADSPGAGTSYRLAGLGAGLVYEIAVATYDEYNNTSSNYVAGTNVTVGGTPYIASTVDVTGFFKAKANATDADSTAFKFGFGVDTGKRGLVFNTNNYWYIDSNQTATLKVGGASTNYIEWNGTSFVIDGDLRAKKGSFSGNINMASGASIYSGTIGGNTVTATGDSGGSLTSAGYILNASGLTFSSETVSGITTIDASTGLFTTASANIGGWNVNASTINKTSNSGTVTLDSSNAQIRVSSSSYTAGIATPNTNSATDIVFWSGGSRDTNANFYVQANGTVVMKSAVITGYASSGDIPDVSGFITAGQVNTNVTSISGGVITTGIIRNAGQSGPSNGSDYSTSGMAINLDNGTLTAKQFRIDSGGNAFFLGTLSSGISLSAPSITGGTIGGASVTVSAAFTSSGLTTASDSGLSESTDASSGGTQTLVGNQSFEPTITLANGKITSSSIMRIEGSEYTEILSGGTQSAIFDSSKSSLIFTTGLYLGNPATSSISEIQNHSTPYVTVDARMRLRRGSPLTYPNGSTGAYIRNIYLKNTTNTPASTTGHVGDIMITY